MEQDFNTKELLNEHGKDITGLYEKISKSYSSERYDVFQEAVEKIVIKTLGSKEGRKEIKDYAKESAKEYNEEQSGTKKNFWTPNIIQIVIGIIAFAALMFAVFKP